MGKYCSEGRRKRLAKKEKGKEMPEERLQLAMKRLVRLCHIKEPADTVCSIIGVRYPASEEEFQATSLAEGAAFDPSRAGKRMKIPTPVTWETELSARGNCAQVWEELIKAKKLPFMAMLRNIRNLLLTGVDRETHEMVLTRLQDPGQVAQSRLFPFRFFSAFEALQVDLEELRKLKEDPDFQPAPPSGKRGLKRGRSARGSRSRARGRHTRSASPPAEEPKPRKKIIPKELPTEGLIAAYKAALETSIKLATTSNVLPVLGHSVIFCDVSGSMSAKLSGGSGLGSVRTCKDAGILLGLMLRYVCESSDVIAFSNPGSHQKCWFPITLPSENILENMNAVNEQSSVLGGGTDFPYDFLQSLIQQHKHVDQMFVFSDMMIAPGEEEMSGTTSGGQSSISLVLEQYRKEVNPRMKFVTVDLAAEGRDILGASFDDACLNVKVHGYSDAILALVSELQKSQVEAVEAFVLEHLPS
jgi:telomerase protein component 1